MNEKEGDGDNCSSTNAEETPGRGGAFQESRRFSFEQALRIPGGQASFLYAVLPFIAVVFVVVVIVIAELRSMAGMFRSPGGQLGVWLGRPGAPSQAKSRVQGSEVRALPFYSVRGPCPGNDGPACNRSFRSSRKKCGLNRLAEVMPCALRSRDFGAIRGEE